MKNEFLRFAFALLCMRSVFSLEKHRAAEDGPPAQSNRPRRWPSVGQAFRAISGVIFLSDRWQTTVNVITQGNKMENTGRMAIWIL